MGVLRSIMVLQNATAPVKAVSESSAEGSVHTNGAETNGHRSRASKTGMTEVADAVSSTFTDQ